MTHTSPCFKTPGSGRVGSKRSARKSAIQRHPASAWLMISKPSLKRLARRAGIIRISKEFYAEASEALKAYLRRCMGKIVPLTEYAKRTTVIPNDVAYALKQMGTTLYMEGCDWTYKLYTREYVRSKVVLPVEQRYLREAAARRTASLAASTGGAEGGAEQRSPDPLAVAPASQGALADGQQQTAQGSAAAAVQAAEVEAGLESRRRVVPAALDPAPAAAVPGLRYEQVEEDGLAAAGPVLAARFPLAEPAGDDAAEAMPADTLAEEVDAEAAERQEEAAEAHLAELPALPPAQSVIKPVGGEPVTPGAAKGAAAGKGQEPISGARTPGVMTPERVKEVQVWLSDVIHGPLSEHGCMRCDHLKTVMRSRHSVSPEEVDDLLYALDKQERIILSDGCLYLAS